MIYTSCTSCQNNTFLDGNTCVNSTSCPNNTYPDTVNNTCALCQTPCSQCIDSAFCLTCISPYYLFVTNGTCHNSSLCPEGTFSVTSTAGNLECLACDLTCQACSTTSTNCTSCSSISQTFLENNICVNSTQCSSGTFPDNATMTCSLCPTTCLLCTDFTTCQSCTADSHLHGTLCVSSCPNGTISINATCHSCVSPCDSCANTTTSCSSCLQNLTNPMFLTSATCVEAAFCPSTTTAITSSLTC